MAADSNFSSSVLTGTRFVVCEDSSILGNKAEKDRNDLQKWLRKRKQKIFRKKTLYMKLPCLRWIPQYTLTDFVADLIAGITVGITVIPQGLAYSTVAGLPPQYGLYAGFMGCFLYVVFGSTQAVTIGPTALMALLSHDVGLTLGPSGSILLAFLAGCIILLLGLLNLGFLVEFISKPVVGGFSSAAALTIATSQMKSLLGIRVSADGFLPVWIEIFNHIEETRLWDTVMGISCIIVLLLLRYLERVKLGKKGQRTKTEKVINKLLWIVSVARNAVVLLICTVAGALIANSLPSEDEMPFLLTGDIEGGLPPFKAPDFSFEFGNNTYSFVEACQEMGSSIIVVPLIAILETMAIAKSFSKGRKFDASQEMIAIGLSNIMGSFVSSFPVTGSFSRTAVNAASGVRTPLNGIYTGGLVLLATSVLTPYFYFIPKSCLAAVIITAVVFMIEIHLFPRIWRTRKVDLIPLVATLLSCLFLSLEYGILIGAAISLAIVLYSTARPRITTSQLETSSGALLIKLDRGLHFPAVDYFMARVRKTALQHRQPHNLSDFPIIIELSRVVAADYTTVDGIKQVTAELEAKGHEVIFRGVSKPIQRLLQGTGKDFNLCSCPSDDDHCYCANRKIPSV